MRRLLFIWLLLVIAAPLTAAAQPASGAYLRAERLGITFISSLGHPANELRYQRALLLGPAWNRWPLYWNEVERQPGLFDWSRYDRLVSGDLRHGLKLDVILLGRPAFHGRSGGIEGLERPIFADGTDSPAAGKPPNAANPWAVFVTQAVNRYKPGGLLAQQEGWPAGLGVQVWEAWNEPDLAMFWSAGVEEYARLLKVTYLAAHAADSDARVMFGGLAYGNPDQDDWLKKVLAIYAQDPNRQAYNWYMDMVAVHNYSYPRRSGLVVRRARETLAGYGLARPIWLNESGVPVWDDYPGPTWTRAEAAARALRATAAQQAAFVVQSTVYAWAEGAEVVFFHQLYDDCGNQPSGTTFPPHNGEWCADGRACWGDAHGLYRNERTADCFSQHPLPGTPRPAAGAFYRLAQIFGSAPFEDARVDVSGGGTRIVFERPAAGERITVLWNRRLEPITLEVEAAGTAARLYSSANDDWTLTPADGIYRIELPPATRDDYPYLPAGEVSAIGGPPFFLVERLNLPTPAAPVTITPGAVIGAPPPRPTTDPAQDVTPPTTAMTPLPVISPATFTVYWSGEDDSGIDRYLIWVRADGGDWTPWLETSATQAQYTGTLGRRYEFAVWAVDLAGNWSSNIELTPQAVTTVG